MTAVLFISHGSHSRQAKSEILRLVRQLKKRIRVPIFQYAFLEINQPTIPSGISACIKKGAKRIFVILNFLNSGEHALKDIPRIIDKAIAKHPHVAVQISPPIGQHPRMRRLYAEVIRKKLQK